MKKKIIIFLIIFMILSFSQSVFANDNSTTDTNTKKILQQIQTLIIKIRL